MSRYASGEGDPIKASKEFKEMVKALHSAGIEVSKQRSLFCPLFSLEPLISFYLTYVTDDSSEIFLPFFFCRLFWT